MFCKNVVSAGRNVEESVYAVSKVTEGIKNGYSIHNNSSDDDTRKSVSTEKDYRYKLQEFKQVLSSNINDCEKKDLNGNVIKLDITQLNGGFAHKSAKKLKQLENIRLHDSVDVQAKSVKILNNGFKRKEEEVKQSEFSTEINTEQEELLRIDSNEFGLTTETEDESLEAIISDFLSYYCKMRDGQLIVKSNISGPNNTPTVQNDQAVNVSVKGKHSLLQVYNLLQRCSKKGNHGRNRIQLPDNSNI